QVGVCATQTLLAASPSPERVVYLHAGWALDCKRAQGTARDLAAELISSAAKSHHFAVVVHSGARGRGRLIASSQKGLQRPEDFVRLLGHLQFGGFTLSLIGGEKAGDVIDECVDQAGIDE